MRPVSMLHAALLLLIATYQLQSTNASPFTRASPLHTQALTVSALVEDTEDFVQVRLLTCNYRALRRLPPRNDKECNAEGRM